MFFNEMAEYLENFYQRHVEEIFEKLKWAIVSSKEETQGIMTKIPDNRLVTIYFSDSLREEMEIITTDKNHVLYSKDFIYIQNEEDDEVSIIPMATVSQIQDDTTDYDDTNPEYDEDLPFIMNGDDACE